MEETIYVKACFNHVSTIFSMYNFQSILNRNHKREPLLWEKIVIGVRLTKGTSLEFPYQAKIRPKISYMYILYTSIPCMQCQLAQNSNKQQAEMLITKGMYYVVRL